MSIKTVLFVKTALINDSLDQITDPIGILAKDDANDYLRENVPDLRLQIFESYKELLDHAKNKEIGGFVYDVPSIFGNYKEYKPIKGYEAYKTLYAEKLRVAVKIGNNDMLKTILDGASKISTQELEEISKKWKLYVPNYNKYYILSFIGFLLGLAIAYFIFRFIKNKRKAKEYENYVVRTDWKMIIDKGENDQTEFKSSLRWDYRLEKINKELEKVIVKTISAFLNTKGGTLFIGVEDNGNILGLDNDYNTFSKKNKDGFLLNLTNLINMHLGKSLHKFIHINIISIYNKDVCIVSVRKSDMPVFVGKQDNEEFYIRASASSQPLGVREAHQYISSHWKKTSTGISS